MAIFGNINTIELDNKRYQEICDYLKRYLDENSLEYQGLMHQESGYIKKVQLSDTVLILEQVYMSKNRENCFYESHQKNIDIHFIVDGCEIIEVKETNLLDTTVPYLAEKDAQKYSYKSKGSSLVLRTGDIAFFHLNDGHMTSLGLKQNEKIVKVVVKVEL